ncbi:MAG TPA: glycosyltransferase family 4 protein [Anaerolineae bacterium]|nr:glycosyltransferase family 4 protein [Anaerolineae bacterium]
MPSSRAMWLFTNPWLEDENGKLDHSCGFSIERFRALHVQLIAQYFKPETVGSGVWIHQLATDLVALGHQVSVVTSFPNYPKRIVFDGYRGRLFMREQMDGVDVVRTYIYASPNEGMLSRTLNYGSFCASASIGGLFAPKPDVIYCVMPPMPLGAVAAFLGWVKSAPVVVNIQDIYPDIAVAVGVLRNPLMIRFFEWMERFIYRKAASIVVIADGFKENIVGKGVPEEKVHVVPNWADPDEIQPGPKDNPFRRQVGVGDRFTLSYSGSLSYNTNLDPVLDAAELLADEDFSFVIVGDGVKKVELERRAQELGLNNLQFLPFQPLERYPQVLAASDMNLVTLNQQAAMASVPSKMFKMMASGRPVLAITMEGNEVHRLIHDSDCGLTVPPDDPVKLAEALRYAASHPEEMERMGRNARTYLMEKHARRDCVGRIEAILKKVGGS